MDKIYSTISHTIETAFPGVEIYKENEGTMEAPAFTILQIDNRQHQQVGNLYKREHSFQIVYMPNFDTTTDYVTLALIGEKLYDILERMEYEGTRLRGLDMNFRIEDNTLSFFITVKTRHYRTITENYMENLEIEERN